MVSKNSLGMYSTGLTTNDLLADRAMLSIRTVYQPDSADTRISVSLNPNIDIRGPISILPSMSSQYLGTKSVVELKNGFQMHTILDGEVDISDLPIYSLLRWKR